MLFVRAHTCSYKTSKQTKIWKRTRNRRASGKQRENQTSYTKNTAPQLGKIVEYFHSMAFRRAFFVCRCAHRWQQKRQAKPAVCVWVCARDETIHKWRWGLNELVECCCRLALAHRFHLHQITVIIIISITMKIESCAERVFSCVVLFFSKKKAAKKNRRQFVGM